MVTDKGNSIELIRMTVYNKDVELITGRTDRYARSVMQRIRRRYKKTRNQLVSVSELAEYLGLRLEDVITQLKLRK
jgi:hypothetical protein